METELANTDVVDFATDLIERSERDLAADLPDWEIEGSPQHTTELRFQGAGGKLIAGTWTSTPGKWRAFGGKDEFCQIVSGHCRLIDDNGVAKDFKAGDSFMIPIGFSGYWEVIETTTKQFVILNQD